MKIPNDIDEFYAVAEMTAAEEFEFGASWRRCPCLIIKTKVFYRKWNEDEIEPIEIGSMKLFKLNPNTDVVMVCDHISSSDCEVGEAIASVMDWDNSGEENFDDDAACAGSPYILSWFEVKEEFRKQRLGHLVLHTGLQASGCEGHPVFMLPSSNKKHAGFDFLTQFYLDADKRTYVVPGSRIVCASVYNDGGSVYQKRQERKEESK